jgi:integrase
MLSHKFGTTFSLIVVPDEENAHMIPKKRLTDRAIGTLLPAPKGKRLLLWDATIPGFAVRVTDTGAKSFVLVTRYPSDKHPTPRAIGTVGKISLASARTKAGEWLELIADGIDPKRQAATEKANTLQAICENYMAREGHKLRSIDQQKATLERLVYPRLGQRPIADIRRSEIVRLMDEIADQRGAAMAGVTLQVIRKVMNWHATRDDTFHSPIVKGMSRGKSKARQRVLSDDELRKVWAASADGSGVFGRLVRFLLLTATRRNEAAQMHRSELHGSDWIIPAERYKTNLPHLVPLSQAALALLPAEGEWMFTAYGTGPVRGFSGLKTAFDTACAVSGWTLHDLRRTARTLMSRAGVSADHAERCLGHVLGTIRGTYDLHSFATEKRQAFEALAGQVDRIVNPRENVVPLRGQA